MVLYLLHLPFLFLRFWFIEAPQGLLSFFASLNTAFLQLLSLPILVRTFFKPWKNEYREGLVEFSIGMGIAIKTFVIIADLVLITLLIFFETAFLILFLMWPLVTVLLLFI